MKRIPQTPNPLPNSPLSIEERKKIEFFIKKGLSSILISKELGRGKNTIVREVRKNGGRNEYNYSKAQEQAEIRRENQYYRISEYNKKQNFNPFNALVEKVNSLEMQVEILLDLIKELRND